MDSEHEQLPDPQRIAKRGDWKIKPMPKKKRMVIPFGLPINLEEMEGIKRGALPYAMEDKWYIFYDEGVLYLHRSWTGICVYIGRFEETQDGGVLTSIEVNRSIEQTSDDPDREIGMFLSIINVLLLGRWPLPPLADEDADPILLWTTLGRAYFKE